MNLSAHTRAASNRANRRCDELMNELEAAMAELTDEHVLWLITFLQIAGRARPYDPRDPWSAMLRRDDCRLSFDAHGYSGLTTQHPPAKRFVVAIDTTAQSQERRATAGHELAHIELDNIGEADLTFRPGEVEHERIERITRAERATDRYAEARFDIDATRLNVNRLRRPDDEPLDGLLRQRAGPTRRRRRAHGARLVARRAVERR